MKVNEEEQDSRGGRFNYPRPISEPPSPTSSRHSSVHGSDDEDEVDEEKEVRFMALGLLLLE